MMQAFNQRMWDIKIDKNRIQVKYLRHKNSLKINVVHFLICEF